eukprot:TRINITY_DN3115_c0_g1_i4.p1 TRINITY_DN3115_c0_g1~~TRINITY_DN3115_c0_g1_i4.p1  ORF type:complete len:358 (+),score=57.52 TRINITY_DN3115_c0_g1_i4:39-1112(+)
MPQASSPYIKAKDVVIDLDLPPSDRWKESATAFKKELKILLSQVKQAAKKVGKRGMSAMEKTWRECMTEHGLSEMVEEVDGLSEALKVDVKLLVLGQMEYELACAGCTSILLQTKTGPLLARTLDWDSALSNLVINVQFMKEGKLVAECPSFMGLVGCTTGVSHANRFTIAMNHRPEMNEGKLTTEAAIEASLAAKFKSAVTVLGKKTHLPVASFLRQVIITCPSYEEAVKMLSERRLCASVYFLICNQKEGLIIQRGKVKSLTRTLPSKPWSFLVQCNHDVAGTRYQDDDSVKRQKRTESFLAKTDFAALTDQVEVRKLLQKHMSTAPIMCDEVTAFYSFSSLAWDTHFTKRRKMK